jgi:hypothetical protein
MVGWVKAEGQIHQNVRVSLPQKKWGGSPHPPNNPFTVNYKIPLGPLSEA